MRSDHASALVPLLTRRSTAALFGPAPSDDELDALLQAAATVPDHGGLRPWRFVIVAGDAREAFGDALVAAAREHGPELGADAAERIRAKAFVAPALIAVAARIIDSPKVPAWEQIASASCAGYALTLAAHQLGLGAIWKSTVHRDGAQLRRLLDLAAADQFLGWVNVGRVDPERLVVVRPPADLSDVARRLDATGVPVPAPAAAGALDRP